MDKKIVVTIGIAGAVLTLQEIILASLALTIAVYCLAGLMTAYALFLFAKAFNSRITAYKARCDRESREHVRQGEYSVLSVGGQSFIVNDSGLLVNASLVSDSYLSMAGPNSDDLMGPDKWAFQKRLNHGRNTVQFQGPETLNFPNPANPGPVALEGPGPVQPEISTVGKILERTQSVRICGSTGLGKTNLAHQVIEGLYRKYGYVYVVNIHADPGTYPDYVKVIGKNLDYAEAKTFLQKLIHICKERYRNEKPNQPQFHKTIPCVIEEVETFHTVVADVWPGFMEAVSTDFRKAGIRVVMIAQSDSVETWGVPGRKSMLNGLDLVKLFVEAGDFYNLYTEAGGAGKSRTKTAWLEVPGYENYDIDEFSFDGDLMPDMVELDIDVESEAGPGIDQGPQTPEQKIIDYISRSGGAVSRSKLTTSKCIGKNSRADNYDLALNPLLESGRVRLQSTGAMKDWIYSV